MSEGRDSAPVDISIVIPVFNEEVLLEESTTELCTAFDELGWDYELILAENGSTDQTVEIGARLSAERDRVTMFSVEEPNYGLALRRGIMAARGRLVICEEIDLCDVDFHVRARRLLDDGAAQMVIGSKAMTGAADERPVFRRLATRVLNGMLRVALDFRGTDTHGLKAFEREVVLPVVERCVIDRDIFASELVVRAYRDGVNVVEIPVRVSEKRRTAIHLVRRVPNVLKNLARLTYVIRANPGD